MRCMLAQGRNERGQVDVYQHIPHAQEAIRPWQQKTTQNGSDLQTVTTMLLLTRKKEPRHTSVKKCAALA